MSSITARLAGNVYRDAAYPAGIPAARAMPTAPAAYRIEFRSSITNVLWEKTIKSLDRVAGDGMRLGIAETEFTSFFNDVEIAHSIGPSAVPTTSAASITSVARFTTLALAARMSSPLKPSRGR